MWPLRIRGREQLAGGLQGNTPDPSVTRLGFVITAILSLLWHTANPACEIAGWKGIGGEQALTDADRRLSYGGEDELVVEAHVVGEPAAPSARVDGELAASSHPLFVVICCTRRSGPWGVPQTPRAKSRGGRVSAGSRR
jgi:hypothetical protein